MKISKKAIVGGLMLSTVVLGLVASGVAKADIQTDTVDEKWGKPTLVYGGSLTDEQVGTVNNALGIKNINNVVRQKVDGQDMVHYLHEGDGTTTMLSSVLVQKADKGTGVQVKIKTPQLITKVTATQYANAAITAGASDVQIEVAAPTEVTGESALTGVYKALEANGQKVDDQRTQLANQELSTISGIADANKDNKNFNSEVLDKAVNDIKLKVAKEVQSGKTLSNDDIAKIVKDTLKANGIDISDDQVNLIVVYIGDFANSDVAKSKEFVQTSNNMKKLFGDILKGAQDKAQDVGFWKGIWNGIVDFFSKAFSWMHWG